MHLMAWILSRSISRKLVMLPPWEALDPPDLLRCGEAVEEVMRRTRSKREARPYKVKR